MGGIADQGEARPDEFAHQHQSEREGLAPAEQPETAEMVSGAFGQVVQEQVLVAIRQPVRGFRTFGPDQRGPVAGQGQKRKRAGGQEMFLGPAAMGIVVAERGDQGLLAVAPRHGADPGMAAQARPHAVGGDQERGLDVRAVGPVHDRGGRAFGKPGDQARRLQHHAELARPLRKRLDHQRVRHHVGKGLAGLDLAVEGQQGRADASRVRLSVTIMSRIGWASAARLS